LQQILTVTATLKKKETSLSASLARKSYNSKTKFTPLTRHCNIKKKEIIATLQIILETSDGTLKHQERTIATR
jgi:lambda repressor-like predicted transcriptional regulator